MPTQYPNKDTLFYDGACGLCERSTRILRRIDWLGRLDFRDFTDIPDSELPVAYETALQGIPMLTRSGRVLVGYRAMRRALLQTPLGSLPALVMYVPVVSHLGTWVYRQVSMRRSRCAQDRCIGPSH